MFLSRFARLSALTKLSLFSLVLIALTAFTAISFSLTQQNIRGKAWYTAQSASVSCDSSGVIITVSFTNTETNPALGMNVTVKDIQTGKTAEMGAVAAGETKKINIPTAKVNLAGGSVLFHLTWTNGKSGVDQRSAKYSQVICTIPTSTPIPTITPTSAPTSTPTPIPTIIPTLVPTATSVPTPTAVPTPTPTPTVMPTNLPVMTLTPVPTSVPVPTSAPNSIFNFNLFLHGIGKGGDSANRQALGNMDPMHTTVKFAVEVFDKNNEPAASVSADLVFASASGSFKGSIDMGRAFAEGVYIVKVKADKYLKIKLPGIIDVKSGEETDLYRAALVAGDINNDNIVNILDYNLLMGCYSDMYPAKDCREGVNADLNDDGKVNQFDYNLFLREMTSREGE